MIKTWIQYVSEAKTSGLQKLYNHSQWNLAILIDS